jgi:L-threonylcarbamoyladenylate synthase
MTRILQPTASAIDEAVALLRAGELVAFPTETVYGLGARALDPAALARIFAAKGRPHTHPLIAHVLNAEDASQLSSHWDTRASALAAKFWPGPLTLIVPRDPAVPASLSGGKETLALRAPAHPVAMALIAALGEPIAAPSANRYQSLSPTTAAHVERALGDRVGLILDGGPCHEGLESTVLDLTVTPPAILRPGPLPLAALRALVPELVVVERLAHEAARHSPGQDETHYAPRTPLHLFPRATALATAQAHPGHIAVVLRQPAPSLPAHVTARVLGDEPVAFARALFATLHELDDADVELILVETPPADEAWLAVHDRLKRAAVK